HLQPIVRSIADVDEAVVRDPHGMHDAELRRRRTVGIVLARLVLVLDGAAERARQSLAGVREVRIVRALAVGAPVPLVRAALRVPCRRRRTPAPSARLSRSLASRSAAASTGDE